MKKTVVSLVVVALAFGALALPAQAGKKKAAKRTMEVRYENPAIGSWVSGGLCIGCPSLPTMSHERYVSVEVTDDVNPGAGIRLRWDENGDDTSDGFILVCGKTDKPVQFPPGVTLDVFPYIAAGPECPGGSATAGSVKATFSAKP